MNPVRENPSIKVILLEGALLTTPPPLIMEASQTKAKQTNHDKGPPNGCVKEVLPFHCANFGSLENKKNQEGHH